MDEIYEIPILELLQEIADPPKRLFVIGTPPTNDELMLAVVGSRKYTSYGKQVCEELIRGLAGYPITIVSGLAIGIDALAHRAALAAGLRTIAVPGSGLSSSVLYPRSNIQLAEEIVVNGGALLSEFDPEFNATEWSFPKRNRIMAGLSKAVLVIEAGEKSGTLITSRLATEYNRDVFAVPGSIFSDNSKGPNMLISLGATPITRSEDILYALGFNPDEKPERDYSGLNDTERQVMETLSEPLLKDVLIAKIGTPVNEANILLMKMEIRGLIREDLGIVRKI